MWEVADEKTSYAYARSYAPPDSGKLGRSMTALGAGSAIASATGKQGQSGSSGRTQADHTRPDGQENQHLENVSDKQSEQLLIPKIKSLILLVISRTG